MILIGLLFGLAAAFFQSLCYIVSGCYVRRTGRPGWTLSAPQRGAMLVPYALLAWFSRPPALDGEGTAVLACAVGVMIFALSGDIGLFQMQKTVEPSRVAPLQSMKVPMIALISFLFLGQTYSVGRLAGIVLVIGSALVLFGAGTRISAHAWFWLAVCCGSYAVSDLFIGYGLVHTRTVCGSVLRSSLFIMGVTGFAGSVLALPIWFAQGRSRANLPTVRECLLYVVPYGLLWGVAMVFLFVCFSLSGVVLGAIAQSTRGLMSVGIGWLLARHGFADLEGPASVGIFVRRAVAAVLVILAMALYAAT